MKKILYLLLLLTPAGIHAQPNYVFSEIITVSGEKFTGYIDFRDWARSPSMIHFTESPDDPSRSYSPADLSEFTVGDQRYISRKVSIDETPFKVPQVIVTLPKSREERVFLKVLVDDELSLYKYQDLRSNYYVEENDQITELISHELVVNQRGKFVFVDTFKDAYIRQLETLNTDCSHVNTRKLDYSESRLTQFVANCNLKPGEELPEALRQQIEEQKGEFRISPLLSLAGYSTDYKRSTSRMVNRTDPFGNPIQVEVIETSTESVQLTAVMIGLEVAYYLPGDLNTRAIISSLAFSPFVGRNDDSFPPVTLVNIAAGYRYKFQSEGLQPFIEPGLSAFVRNGEFYRENGNERLILGLRLGLGFEKGSFWAIIRGELHNKRYETLRQDGISIALGMQF